MLKENVEMVSGKVVLCSFDFQREAFNGQLPARDTSALRLPALKAVIGADVAPGTWKLC